MHSADAEKELLLIPALQQEVGLARRPAMGLTAALFLLDIACACCAATLLEMLWAWGALARHLRREAQFQELLQCPSGLWGPLGCASC